MVAARPPKQKGNRAPRRPSAVMRAIKKCMNIRIPLRLLPGARYGRAGRKRVLNSPNPAKQFDLSALNDVGLPSTPRRAMLGTPRRLFQTHTQTHTGSKTVAGGRGGTEGDVGVLSPRSSQVCWICYGNGHDGEIIAPCQCMGSVEFVHVGCLQKWLTTSSSER